MNNFAIFLDSIFLKVIDIILESTFQAFRMMLLLVKKDIEKILRTIFL